MQNAQMPPAPLNLDKYLQELNQKLANMKRQNAQQLGVLVQAQSEQIGRQHDGLIQEIGPLVQEVGRLQLEVEELKKQIPVPLKKVAPTEKVIQNTTTDAARDPPQKMTPELVPKVSPKK